MKLIISESQLVRLLKENTADSFISMVNNRYPDSEKLNDFILDFIGRSKSKFVDIKHLNVDGLGVAISGGVVLNTKAFSFKLNDFLFILFHELAHVYQFKKYGVDAINGLFFHEGDINDVVDKMIQIELVADRVAMKKLHQLKQMGLIDSTEISGGFIRRDNYSMRLGYRQHIKNMGNIIKDNNIENVNQFTDHMYNYIVGNVN